MKLAFVVQRYGREILGGAETLARQIAERLARRHDIEVFTSTARDYITWANEYPPGEEKLRGVRIRRFPVVSERNLEEFNRFSEWIYGHDHSGDDEIRWLEMQGPIVPELVNALRKDRDRFDLIVFFTYLYYPTYFGLQVAPEKSTLVPTAHDEPPLKLEIFKEVFARPSSFLFNTEAEELLVLDRFHGVYKKMRETIGIGMELLDLPDAAAFRRRNKLPGRFLLYAGRIDEGKGCGELMRFFRFYKDEVPEAGNLHLVFIGQLSMKLPEAKDIRYLGFLDEEEKLAAMAAATAVVIPSQMESLSIVALEALSLGTPIIVRADSPVLVEHCRKSNAGLYYADYDDFEGIVNLLLTDKALVKGLGRQGKEYIKDNFGWEKLLPRYELALRSFARAPRPAAPPAPEPRGDAPAAEEPAAEERKAEEPAAEEPKPEEPAAEEPKWEEPEAEEPKSEEPTAETLAGGKPEAEEPVAEESKAEEHVGKIEKG
jgi:glycosyltransferase involved in cell wall biosynthesis